MYHIIKSWWLVIYIFMQKMLDILHRYIYGLPNIKKSQITAHLYLGSQYNLIGLKKLKALGVTAIVNMREHRVYSKAKYAHIKYLHLPTVDNTPPTMDILLKGANFIETEINMGGTVYVHCRQGLGRGPTMAIAYLIKAGATYYDAFNTVKRVRPFIDPRPTQIAQLKHLEIICHTNPKNSTI
ncbi:protein-tyrosine phosphatase family protein [Mucilaginibacter psychrotolerans]|uniref:Protein phosphatase n=1 Tax=Mucilaginibacter psychrotolerans TaxID=1524096 RepID=A0A4Y8S9E8_9SPHI|nr:dual specificity protein phosphatase [Mucilaginibacter psychrotolerans]TFF35649.1 protein phosphatase [Mucilaginibacter psychrotolerans]